MTQYSYSKISTYLKCPRAFRYRYVEKAPEAFTTIELHLGRCVHTALEWAYARRAGGHDVDGGDIERAYEKAWKAEDVHRFVIVKRGTSHEDYFLLGKGQVTSFAGRVFMIDDSRTLELEKRFSIDLGEGIRYTGVVDRISQAGDGLIRITDYKTGKNVSHPAEDLQVRSYGVYAVESYSATALELCCEDLRGGTNLLQRFGSGECGEVRERIAGQIDSIENTRDYEANPSVLCGWCGFNTVCEDARPGSRWAGGQSEPATGPDAANDAACPDCGGTLRERSGKFGRFIGCGAYPSCRYTRNEW